MLRNTTKNKLNWLQLYQLGHKYLPSRQKFDVNPQTKVKIVIQLLNVTEEVKVTQKIYFCVLKT